MGKKRVTITIDEEKRDRFAEYAEEQGYGSLSLFLEKAAEERIRRYANDEADRLLSKLQRAEKKLASLYRTVRSERSVDENGSTAPQEE